MLLSCSCHFMETSPTGGTGLLASLLHRQSNPPPGLALPACVVPVAGVGHWQLNYDPTSCLADEANTLLDLGVPSSPQLWTCAQSVPLPDFAE